MAENTNDNSDVQLDKVDWNVFSRKMIREIINYSNIIETGYIGDVKLEDVQHAMNNPQRHWRILLLASEQLMRISPHYYKLNTMYSNMTMFCWWLDLDVTKETANVENIKKHYKLLASRLENMCLKDEFAKIMRVLPYRDIYCGLVIESTSDFFFQEVNYNICKLYQVQDGLYNFKINLSAIKVTELDAYPDYVQKAYIDFVNGELGTNWYAPPGDKQICIKMNRQWTYPYPILINVIKDILDLDVFKKLKLQSARTDNYKAIVTEVPIDQQKPDTPLISPETLGIFAEINRESMTDDIGLIHTLGSKGEAISFKDSSNTRNNVSDANDEIYNSSGQTKELFNGSSSATAVTFSVENASGVVYDVYRQLERWVNRYIKLRKYNKNGYKFWFYLLDITRFNRDNVSNRYKDAVALGASVIDKWMASLDMTPSRMLGSYIVHNDIFDFQNNFKPLATSYNGAVQAESENEPGRPKNSEKGKLLDESGEKTEDEDGNDR